MCPVCARTYPVLDGIVHFIEAAELSGQNRRFAHLYDWFSWVYAPSMRASFALIGMTERTGRNQVLDRLTPRGGRVLEVSVGSGPNLPYLLDRPDVGEVHGLDISIGQLRRCRALVRRRGWSVPLYLGTAEALPFADNAFDAVLHVGGINFFNDKARAIAEMVRVAKPGAHVVIVDEKERAAKAYERTLPGFKTSFATSDRRSARPSRRCRPEWRMSWSRTSGGAGSTASSSTSRTHDWHRRAHLTADFLLGRPSIPGSP